MWSAVPVVGGCGGGVARSRVSDSSRMILMESGLRSALFVLLTVAILGDGTAAFEVLLRTPNYVFVGDSALLKCEHGVSTALLHKVEWLKDGDHKLFQFVRGRNPPFRNFTTPGATLDWSRSNEHEIHLTGLSLEASGIYSCEVSMETPIYTKPSNDERLVVIQRQSEDPVVRGAKPSYFAGEKIAVNCTTSPTHPPVRIAWLVNGRQVSDQLLTSFPEGPARQYELATHGAHHIRPFRARSDDDDGEDDFGRETSVNQPSALGTPAGRDKLPIQIKGQDNDFLASAALGKLKGTQGTAASSGGVASGRIATTATTTTTPSTSPGVDEDEGYAVGGSDSFDPPEVVPVVTAKASSSTVQLSFVLTDQVVQYLKRDSEDSEVTEADPDGVPKARLILTCVAIIPDFVDAYGKFADRRLTSVAADVILSEETTARFSSASPSISEPPRPWVLFPLLTALLLLAAPTLPQAPLTSWFLATPLRAAPTRFRMLSSTGDCLNHVRPQR